MRYHDAPEALPDHPPVLLVDTDGRLVLNPRTLARSEVFLLEGDVVNGVTIPATGPYTAHQLLGLIIDC